MIRRILSFLFFLIKLALVGTLAVWVYLNPGDVTLNWQGQVIRTSFGFATLVLVLIIVVAAVVYHGWRVMLGWPEQWRKYRKLKSLELGYNILNKGLLAVAASDTTTATKQAKKAVQLLPDAALTHLLAAQAAQLRGDEVTADAHLAKLAQHPDGELFGLRGQLTRALKRNDKTEALRLARQAYTQQPSRPWAVDTTVQLEARHGNWLQVEKVLRAGMNLGTADKQRWEKDLSAALCALSDQSLKNNDVEAALECAREAVKRNPGWSPAAVRTAKLWQRKAYRRRAQKALLDAWELNPHPDLVATWLLVAERGDSLVDTVESLTGRNPDNAEAAFAMASACMKNGLWGVARTHALRAIEYRGDRAAYRLMAEIEQGDSNDPKKIRAWHEKADDAPAEPQWICRVTLDRFDTWQPLNRQEDFNTIMWQTPHETGATALTPSEPQAVLI